VGVRGTPAVYTADGRQLGGYVPAAELLQQLGLR
jgi:protein-disulfide isomerase